MGNPPNKERKEKKGGSVAWSSALGAKSAGEAGSGFELLTGVSRSLGSASSSSLTRILGAVSRATGLDTAAAGKFALAALVLGSGTIAAGLSLWITSSAPPSRAQFGSAVFPGAAGSDAAPSRRASGDGTQAGPSALDYFAQANSVQEELAGPSSEAPAEPAPALKAAAKAPPEPAKKLVLPKSEEKPKLKAGALPGAAAAGSQATLQATPSLAGKRGGEFQAIYKRDYATAFARGQTSSAARTKSAVLSRGSKAFNQLQGVQRISRQGASMGNADGASQTASSAFDASNGRRTTLGATSGGTFKPIGASNTSDVRTIGEIAPPEPVKDTENKTPYQNLIYAGMAALLTGQMLVMAAGALVSAAQKDPMAAPQLLAAAKAVAAAAVAAGGSAVGIGGVLGDKFGQMTQGMPYMMGGAVIIAQAGIVLMKAEQAGQEAQQGVADAGSAAQSASDAQLQPPQIPMMPQQQSNDSPPPEPKKPPVVNIEKPNDPGFQGSIDVDKL